MIHLCGDQRQGEGGEDGGITRGEGNGPGLSPLRPQSPALRHLQPVAACLPGCALYP